MTNLRLRFATPFVVLLALLADHTSGLLHTPAVARRNHRHRGAALVAAPRLTTALGSAVVPADVPADDGEALIEGLLNKGELAAELVRDLNETVGSVVSAPAELLGLAVAGVQAPDWTSDKAMSQGNATDGETDQSLSIVHVVRTMTLPVLCMWLTSPLLSLIDTASVGNAASLVELAALGPATSICDYGTYFFGFMSLATTNLVAKYLARKDTQRAARAAADGIVMSAVIGAVWSAVLLLPLGQSLLGLYITPANPAAAELMPYALNYARIRALGFIPALVGTCCQAAALARREVKLPLVAVALASVANIIGDAVLVFGLGMGSSGAAIATVAAQCAACAVLLRNERKHIAKATVAMTRSFKTRVRDLTHFARRCVSPAFALMGKASIGMAVAATASTCGTISLAAHQVCVSTYLLFCPMGDAIAQTAQTVLPQAQANDLTPEQLAAQKSPAWLATSARKFVKSVALAALGLGCVDAFAASALPMLAPWLFTSSTAVASTMLTVAPLMGACLFFHAMSSSLEGILFASDDASFLGRCYMFNSVTALAVFHHLRNAGAELTVVWTTFLIYNMVRVAQFGARHITSQRRLQRQAMLEARPVQLSDAPGAANPPSSHED